VAYDAEAQGLSGYLYTRRCNHIPPVCFTAQPVLGLLRPFRHFLRSLTFRRAFAPLLLPISLRIPEEASRVQQEGLKRNA